MYVTRRLSELLKSPETLEAQTDGPNSGYLVIQDKESGTSESCYFGLVKFTGLIRNLPFPQNKDLIVNDHPLHLIPVLDQPLSSNRYYAIAGDVRGFANEDNCREYPEKDHEGEAFEFTINKMWEEVDIFCLKIVTIEYHLPPVPFDPSIIYQQFEIVHGENDHFFVRSIYGDLYPPSFLRNNLSIKTRCPKFKLDDMAHGLNTELRARLPPFDFSPSRKSSNPIVVGKWYCPFMFIKDGTPIYQVRNTPYYEMTLVQRWERIFSCVNSKGINSVMVDASVDTEEVFVCGREAVCDERVVVEGVIWCASRDRQRSVGLRTEIVERMKWEQERGGWKYGEKRVNVNEVEEYKGKGKWSVFGRYVLVERFNLKRMNGDLVMSYDFVHLDNKKNKWE